MDPEIESALRNRVEAAVSPEWYIQLYAESLTQTEGDPLQAMALADTMQAKYPRQPSIAFPPQR